MQENSMMNLPVGFRFEPTDKELVHEYLMKRISSSLSQLSSMAVVDWSDVYSKHPWHIAVATIDAARRMERDGALYFFVPMTKKKENGWGPNRRTGDMGFWKSTSGDQPVLNCHGNVVGMKNSLNYFFFPDNKKTTSKDGIRTSWIIHEYHLVDPNNPTTKKFHEYTLCRISNSGRSSCMKDLICGQEINVADQKKRQQQHKAMVAGEAKQVEGPLMSQELLSFQSMTMVPIGEGCLYFDSYISEDAVNVREQITAQQKKDKKLHQNHEAMVAAQVEANPIQVEGPLSSQELIYSNEAITEGGAMEIWGTPTQGYDSSLLAQYYYSENQCFNVDELICLLNPNLDVLSGSDYLSYMKKEES